MLPKCRTPIVAGDGQQTLSMSGGRPTGLVTSRRLVIRGDDTASPAVIVDVAAPCRLIGHDVFVRDPAAALSVLRDRLGQLCAEQLAPDAASLVQQLARPAVHLRHVDEPTRSHLGGLALLDPDSEWPTWGDKPLSLVAVIDLEELVGLVTDVRLPTTGVLNFFYEADEQQAWGFEPSHRDGWRVVLTESDGAASRPAPEGALVFPSIGLAPHQILCVPGWEEPAVDSIVPPHRPRPSSRLEELRTRRTREQEEPSARRTTTCSTRGAW